jgi:hypothetical protein
MKSGVFGKVCFRLKMKFHITFGILKAAFDLPARKSSFSLFVFLRFHLVWGVNSAEPMTGS